MPVKPKMNPVNSSNLASVGYNEEAKELFIEFHNGKTYKYWPVTAQGYQDFINAPSLGEYHQRNIRNNSTLSYAQV